MNKHARKYDEANEGYLRVLSCGQQEDFFPEPKVALTKELVYNLMVTLSSNSHKAWVELVQP